MTTMHDARAELLTEMIRSSLADGLPGRRLLEHLCGERYSPADRAILDAWAEDRARNIASYVLAMLVETARRADGVIPLLDSQERP